jgi:plastocyanin
MMRAVFWMTLAAALAGGYDALADEAAQKAATESATTPPPARSTELGTIAGSVSVLLGGEKKRDRSNVVVYLENGPKPAPESANLVLRVQQKDKQFRPQVLVAPLGSSLAFPNEDKIFHNVFSLSKAARFDLGLYKSGESKLVKPKKVGVIDVFCNIHPQMFAKILVVDTQHYAVTEADGRFTIPAVPVGTYQLVAWQAKGEKSTTQVSVARGRTSKLEIELVESTERERHRRKDGTPYGRYE